MGNMDLNVEPLESLESPWDWGHFFTGVAIGVALVGIGIAAAT